MKIAPTERIITVPDSIASTNRDLATIGHNPGVLPIAVTSIIPNGLLLIKGGNIMSQKLQSQSQPQSHSKEIAQVKLQIAITIGSPTKTIDVSDSEHPIGDLKDLLLGVTE